MMNRGSAGEVGITYTGHDNAFHVGENVVPMFSGLRCLLGYQVADVSRLHLRENAPFAYVGQVVGDVIH